MDKLKQILHLFNTQDPGKVPIHYAIAFLFIAEHHSVTYREIEEELGSSNASASRVVNGLGPYPRHRQYGYGWVETFIDPEEGRRYRVRLSAKGQAMYRDVERVMN